MKRLLPLALVALLLSACASGHTASKGGSPQKPTPQKHMSVHALASLREHRAGLQAVNLLSRISLPAGAHPARVPSSLRTSNLGVSVITEFAYRRRAWLVPHSPDAVARFVKANPLPGFESHVAGRNFVGFDREPAHGWPMQRMYSVDFAPAARPGWTVVKTEAAAAWIYPRSPKEVVPAGVHEVDIRGGGVSEHVTDPAKIARIIGWFDAVDPAPHVTVGCMLIVSTRLSFAFRGANGRTLATASVPSEASSSCNPIAFTVGGKRLAPLVDERYGRSAFVSRVQRLLGVRFQDVRRSSH